MRKKPKKNYTIEPRQKNDDISKSSDNSQTLKSDTENLKIIEPETDALPKNIGNEIQNSSSNSKQSLSNETKDTSITLSNNKNLDNNIKIFQIYFEPWQRDLLDPKFTAIDNSKFVSESREFDVFNRLSKSEFIKGAKLWGALSWRFTEKTGMVGNDLVREILANPNQDLYFCNPEPEYEGLYHNLWLQGIPSHPKFMEVCQAFFKAVGLPLDNLIAIESIQVSSSANFFIGSQKFWTLYIPWVQNLLNVANKKMPSQMRDLLHSNIADDKKIHNGATYVPFIIERLLPVFLKTVGSSLKFQKITMTEPLKKLDVHIRLLREMKDVAYKTNSPWLAACWVNYRNLYLTQVKGVTWSKIYLRQVTPEKIIFK